MNAFCKNFSNILGDTTQCVVHILNVSVPCRGLKNHVPFQAHSPVIMLSAWHRMFHRLGGYKNENETQDWHEIAPASGSHCAGPSYAFNKIATTQGQKIVTVACCQHACARPRSLTLTNTLRYEVEVVSFWQCYDVIHDGSRRGVGCFRCHDASIDSLCDNDECEFRLSW